ncbi:MAG: PAS domain S-box protein, partial [Mucilaginibacter sp.]|nr:PAS domain S-box protein [Mucilaginibacter sp.]
NFQFLDVNEAALRQYGYKKEEFLTMTIMDIRYAGHIAETIDVVNTNKISGKFYGGNSQHLKKNGEVIHVKIESNLLFLEGRQVRLVQATDITPHVTHQLEVCRFNSAIKESESNLRALFDSSIDGFVLLDAQKKIKLFNPRASTYIHYNRNKAPLETGRSILDFVENSRQAYFAQFLDKVYSGENVDYDRMYRTGRNIRWIRYTLTPVLEEQLITGACITGRDVTARKLYLQSIEEQNKEFREISWIQSHMVRAPVARIMGLLQILDSESRPNEQQLLITYLQQSAKELDLVIKDITNKSVHIIDKYPQFIATD